MLSFDKRAFAEVLAAAKGDRSINGFGLACNVDPGYLSRLLRGLLQNPPSPAILAKIAAQALNGVTYQELMQAAGILRTAINLTDFAQEIIPPMQILLQEMMAFFRMQPDLTEEEKEILIEEMRDYFQYKAMQTRKKSSLLLRRAAQRDCEYTDGGGI